MERRTEDFSRFRLNLFLFIHFFSKKKTITTKTKKNTFMKRRIQEEESDLVKASRKIKVIHREIKRSVLGDEYIRECENIESEEVSHFRKKTRDINEKLQIIRNGTPIQKLKQSKTGKINQALIQKNLMNFLTRYPKWKENIRKHAIIAKESYSCAPLVLFTWEQIFDSINNINPHLGNIFLLKQTWNALNTNFPKNLQCDIICKEDKKFLKIGFLGYDGQTASFFLNDMETININVDATFLSLLEICKDHVQHEASVYANEVFLAYENS